MIRVIVFICLLFPLFINAQVNQKDASGKKHGRWIVNFENSTQAAYDGTFDHGKRTGLFRYYYTNGKVKAAMIFSKNGTFARAQLFFEDGKLIATGNYINEKKDSVWTYYGGSGYVRKREGWKKGMLEGKTTVYMEPQPGDTKLKAVNYVHYKDSILQGDFAEFYPTGKIKLKGKYVDGNMDGSVYGYYENGARRSVESYKYAVRHGLWVYYNTNGTVNKKRYFDRNRELKGNELKAKLEELDN